MLTFELLSNVRHLLINPLLFQLPHARTADIRDELDMGIEGESGETVAREMCRAEGQLTCVRPRMLVAMLGEINLVM